MDFFTGMQVAASGLSAERTRINVAASNLANASTTGGPGGIPYKRHDVVLRAEAASALLPGARAGGAEQAVFGVRVDGVVEDASPPRLEYDPTATPTPTPTVTSLTPTSTWSRRWST